MKAFLFLALCILTVSSTPVAIEKLETSRVNGQNGWYVPQLNGEFKWISMQQAENALEKLELMEERGTVPVQFYLYTKANPIKRQKLTADDNSISGSNFNSTHSTRTLIHGWIQSYTADMNKELRDAFLSQGDHNVIVVDWGRARGEYATAVAAVERVGKKVANFMDYLVQNHGLSLQKLYIVGHSLGAHVAGYAGKNVQSGQVHTIVGLDPALPLFNYDKPNKRLESKDAYYVESIQTNGGTLGFLKPIGKGAFYPNGGETQPGCHLDLTGACSHGRSTVYYAEAVRQNNFGSIKCGNYEDAVAKQCGNTFSSARMGADTNAYAATGDFYVPVNGRPPYGIIN